MELVRERQTTQMTNTELEAQRHNAQISERYRKLQSAEADQFAQDTHAEVSSEPVRASVLAPEAPIYISPVTDTPAMQQTPEVTDYVREIPAASVFTAEKFENPEIFRRETSYAMPEVIAPTYVAPVIEQAPATSAAAEVEASFSLTPLAKIVMAVFTVVVCAMLAMIGVNSNIISNKKMKIKNLEEKKEQLVEQHDEIQRQIELAQSEDTIRAWAAEQGYVEAGN